MTLDLRNSVALGLDSGIMAIRELGAARNLRFWDSGIPRVWYVQALALDNVPQNCVQQFFSSIPYSNYPYSLPVHA